MWLWKEYSPVLALYPWHTSRAGLLSRPQGPGSVISLAFKGCQTALLASSGALHKAHDTHM